MNITCLKFPTLSIVCVGKDDKIEDINTFFRLKSGRIDMEMLIQRIINNGIYAGIHETSSAKAKLDSISLNKKLKKNRLYISDEQWLMASFICNTDEMGKMLELDESEIEDTLQYALEFWKDKGVETENSDGSNDISDRITEYKAEDDEFTEIFPD